MPLHVSSTVVLIIRSLKLYYTASVIVTLCRWPSGAQFSLNLCTGRPPTLCLKNVDAYNNNNNNNNDNNIY